VTFTSNGDAKCNGKLLKGWLKSRTPPVKKGTMFSIDGPVLQGTNVLFEGVQLDSYVVLDKYSQGLNKT